MDQAELNEIEAIAEDQAKEKAKPQPPHVRAFYDRMTGQLDAKGVWGNSQVAQSMKALMLREQNVASKRTPEPFGRRDRKALVKKLAKEGKLVKQAPRDVRGTAGVIQPATVDALLENTADEHKSSPEAITMYIASLFGIQSAHVLARRTLRAKRFMLNNPGRRVPMHVREGAVISTAIAVAAVALFPDTQDEAVHEAVRLLREKYNAPVPA